MSEERERMKCANCRYWSSTDHRKLYPDIAPLENLEVRDQVTCERVEPQPFELRACLSPKVRFYERPEVDGAAVVDGSEYMGYLITGPEFGCTAFEPAASSSERPNG
jgi:hypothetical protein